MNLSSPILELNKVGSAVAKKLNKIGIHTIEDLLYYFPFRYEDYQGVVSIKNLQAGTSVSIRAKVELISSRRSFRSRKTMTEALISDDSGSLRIIWFNQPYVIKSVKVGDELIFSGMVKTDMLGPELINPSFSKINVQQLESTPKFLPVYFLTAGLSQKYLHHLVGQALDAVKDVSDFLSAEILDKYDLLPLLAALQGIHFPLDNHDLANAQRRLKFDELFLIQLKAELSRRAHALQQAPVLKFKEKEIKELVSKLPFVLTQSQKLAAWEILKDLSKNIPMNRLLSGDVGSGKTVVAAIALYNAILNGYQGILLTPTEILARQHFYTIVNLLSGLGVRVGLYTRSQFVKNLGTEILDSQKLKKDILTEISTGEINIAIGTQALLGDKVEFKKLGMAVVDEQHRFGVEQRKSIKAKGAGVHFLSMTATPIPRSLALTLYGDLDLSTIDEMPADRKPIMTRLVESYNRQKAYDFIRKQIRQGRQAFVICPLIEDSGDEKKSVLQEYKKLSQDIFPELKVDFLHGRMKPKEKELAMEKFKNNQTNVLVSTSVVEVGVDIPNASVMMVEGAERFGLAQLHQFRGRVGRSIYQSYCFVFSDNNSEKTLERLQFFEKNISGFKLAEKDLETRGPGEVYGTEQSGTTWLRLAKLTDLEVIKIARSAAIWSADNLNTLPKLKQKIKDFEEKIHLE